jgi:hypothetical protein
MLNQRYRGFPQFYTNVMRNWMYKALPGGDSAYQYNETETYCSEKNKVGCDKYVSGEWMTFYYEQHIAKWGEAKSTIKAYWAREGKPLKQYIHLTDWKFSQDKPGTDNAFRTVWIGPFSVDRTSGKNYPAAETWYDEFIISSQPIADPNKATTGIHHPIAETGFDFAVQSNRLNSSITFSLKNPKGNTDVFVHDMWGRKVLGISKARGNTLEWRPSSPKDGVYLVQIRTGNQSVSKKISLLK